MREKVIPLSCVEKYRQVNGRLQRLVSSNSSEGDKVSPPSVGEGVI